MSASSNVISIFLEHRIMINPIKGESIKQKKKVKLPITYTQISILAEIIRNQSKKDFLQDEGLITSSKSLSYLFLYLIFRVFLIKYLLFVDDYSDKDIWASDDILDPCSAIYIYTDVGFTFISKISHGCG